MSTYRDISLTLAKHPNTKDILKKIDVDAVKASMINVLFSSPFDKPFDPHYGADLRKSLFENVTPSLISIIKKQMTIMLSEYEPRCIIQELYVADDGDTGLNIGILFYVVGNQTQLNTLNYNLQRVR